MDNFGFILKHTLVFFSLAYAGSVILIMLSNMYPHFMKGKTALFSVISSLYIAGTLTIVLIGGRDAAFIALVYSIIIVTIFYKLFPNFTLSGKYFFITNYILLFVGGVWGVYYIWTVPISLLTRVLLFSGLPFFILSTPLMFLQFFENFEVLTHNQWKKPRFPGNVQDRVFYPKISLHVPTHAEPPDMVMDTLNLLARVDYPNYEVLVIDNNTTDPNLWRPLEEHCSKLGPKFKFIHLEHVEGAKAGALNYAIQKTADDAEIIGVIDADYKAHVLFLKALVSFFDDPKMGFIQTPHDYLGWENNTFLTMCYWEYELFFKTTMVSLNERNSAITVGTMCLIRKKALTDAGGWAQWCLTEDSELAIRIHALGYESLNLHSPFGWGTIPETFAGYKKQRFRWTAGPIQELKHHFSLISPLFSKKSALTFAQKVEHFNHGLDRANIGLGFLLTPIGLGIIFSIVYQQDRIQVPFELWLFATIMLISSFVLNIFVYKFIAHCPNKDIIGALIASKSLTHIITLASIAALFKKSFAWHRTDKFKQNPSILNTLSSARDETIIGCLLLIFVVSAYIIYPVPGLYLMILIGLFYRCFDYFCATYMAIISELELRRLDKLQVPPTFVRR